MSVAAVMLALFSSSDAAVIIAGLLAGLVGILAIGVPLWISMHRGQTVLGEARDNAAEARVASAAIVKQMHANAGTTIRDSLDRIERHLAENRAWLNRLDERMVITAALVVDIGKRVTATEDRLTNVEEHEHPDD